MKKNTSEAANMLSKTSLEKRRRYKFTFFMSKCSATISLVKSTKWLLKYTSTYSRLPKNKQIVYLGLNLYSEV